MGSFCGTSSEEFDDFSKGLEGSLLGEELESYEENLFSLKVCFL